MNDVKRWHKGITAAERDKLLRHHILNVGAICLDCGEDLTQEEKDTGPSYCFRCWPKAERKEDDDADQHA